MNGLVGRIHALLESDSPADNDETDRLVAKFLGQNSDNDLVAVTFASSSGDTDPRCIATFLDVLLWFPGVDVRSLVMSLERHYRDGKDSHVAAIELMDATIADNPADPFVWIRHTFPELADTCHCPACRPTRHGRKAESPSA